MSKRLQVTDTLALAFGFNWLMLDPFESRGERLTGLLAQGNRWQASFRRAGNDHVGVSKEDFSALPKIRTVAGAPLMAGHPKLAGQTAWIVMEEPGIADEQGDGGAGAGTATGTHSEMAVVGLLNGNIVIDDVVDQAGYLRLHAVFQERCKKAKAPWFTAGTSYSVGKLVLQLGWEDFLPTRGNAAVPVRALEHSVQGRILAALAVAVTLAGVHWGYVRWDDERVAEQARLQRARAMQNIPAMYTAAVGDILGQPVLRANSAFVELRSKLHDFPLKLAGWDLHKIECQAASAACSATWINTLKLGTNRAFAAAAPREWDGVVFAPSGEEVTHRLPFKLSTAPLPGRETWPRHAEFLLRQFSQWQSYWVVGFRPALTAQPRIVGMVAGLDQDSAAAFPDATWATPWSIEKTDWFLSEGFDSAPEKGDANLPDSVTVNNITLRVDRNHAVKFEANGLIYARM